MNEDHLYRLEAIFFANPFPFSLNYLGKNPQQSQGHLAFP